MTNGTWSFNDAVNGFCNANDIGKPRPSNWEQSKQHSPAGDQQQQNDRLPTVEPMTDIERRQVTVDIMDAWLRMARKDPAGFIGSFGPQATKLIDVASKLIAQEDDKHELEEMTAKAFMALPADRKAAAVVKILLNRVAPDQLAAARADLGLERDEDMAGLLAGE